MPRLKITRRRRVHIGKAWWVLEYVANLYKDRWGDCDWGKQRIRIRDKAAGVDRMDVIIHEVAHSRFPDLTEEAVTEFASITAAILHEDGFIRQDDEED
jgi:hypothetical protein